MYDHKVFAEAYANPQERYDLPCDALLEKATRVCWYVVIHFKGKVAAAAARQTQPSFFVHGVETMGVTQVHVIETPIYNYQKCLLVPIFRERSDGPPSLDAISTIRNTLQKHLDLQLSTRSIVTTDGFGMTASYPCSPRIGKLRQHSVKLLKTPATILHSRKLPELLMQI